MEKHAVLHTWEWEGDFCSARFVQSGRVARRCVGCWEAIPIGTSSWRVFSPGGSHSVCEECWDHLQGCTECRSEQADWEQVARCRRLPDP